MLLCFLLFEYLRLHDVLPILKTMKVQTAVLAALVLIVIAEMGKGEVRLTRQGWLLLGFLGLASFTILTATNNYYAYEFAFELALMLIAYFAITHILRNERDVKSFLSLLVGIHVYIAVKVIIGYEGFTAGSYFLGDENDVALAMTLMLPLGVYLSRQTQSLPARTFWGASSIAMLLSIILSRSRGGFVGIAAIGLYYVVTGRNKSKAVGVLVLSIMIVIAVAPEGYWEEMETIKETDSGTAETRRNYWAAARRMFYDSPIWGVGGNNYRILLPDYAYEVSPEQRGTQWGKAAHSMFFDLLAEFGLLGVLLIASVLLWNFRDLREVRSLSEKGNCSASIQQLADCLRLSWVGFLVPAVFLSVLRYPHLYYLTALTVVAHRLALAESEIMAVEPIGALESGEWEHT
ncbi:MAG: O-antigen ligase family protein [Candidatus Methylomirabilales bacterium]